MIPSDGPLVDDVAALVRAAWLNPRTHDDLAPMAVMEKTHPGPRVVCRERGVGGSRHTGDDARTLAVSRRK